MRALWKLAVYGCGSDDWPAGAVTTLASTVTLNMAQEQQVLSPLGPLVLSPLGSLVVNFEPSRLSSFYILSPLEF